MKIDIIVPIYNAYDYTIKCIDSVINNTNPEIYTLVLINDKSTDPNIGKYLYDLNKKKYNNIVIIENEENLGFVGTVNKGMRLSSNDVVLLNSDTEVTEGWLDKMIKAAYLNERIATVTPLTNNGTICSVPNYCEDNELPENLTLEEYADIIEKTSLKLYPDIPTAVGFCMYIKRKVIDEIGLFDEESFGKGYGEENDFCCRALESGYTHILCDDTFIYHKGSTSFLESKKDYVQQNLEILNKRYPYYDFMIQKFIQRYSLKPIIDNVKFQLKIRNNKKNILFILHNDFSKGENHPVGGTEYHTKDIIENFSNINSFILYTNGKEICLSRFESNSKPINFKFELNSILNINTFSSYDYKEKLSDIVDYFNVDTIHIQHFRTHTFDVIDIAREREIPLYLTLHDYYLICPKVNLLDIHNKYCEKSRNDEMCSKCLSKQLGYKKNILKDWNSVIYSNLKHFEKIFAPSESVVKVYKEYYEKKFGSFDVNIEVLEHGIDLSDYNKDHTQNNDKFKVAFIGGLSPNKGSKLIHDVILNNKNDKIEWHIFGNIGDQSLNLLENNNLIKHGRYERNNIQELLTNNNINLVCILSIWPETYSYTLSESIAAGIPVIATDIGALSERINRYGCGWLIPYSSDRIQLTNKISYIIENNKDYLDKINNIKNVKFNRKDEVAKEYERNYIYKKDRFIKSNTCYNKIILDNYKINNSDIVFDTSAEILKYINELNEKNENLTKEINDIRGTIGWKLMEYIRTKHPRLKLVGKKLIYNFSRLINKS